MTEKINAAFRTFDKTDYARKSQIASSFQMLSDEIIEFSGADRRLAAMINSHLEEAFLLCGKLIDLKFSGK